MTIEFDPNSDPNAAQIIGLLGVYGVASAAASALTDPPIIQAIKGIQTLRDVNEVESKMIQVQHSDIPPELHFAIELMFLANLFRGNPFPPDADTVMQSAWETVNEQATDYGYSSNEEFWEALNAQFPDDFQLDSSGALIQPASIAAPLSTPDWSRPFTPLVPGALAPAILADVQPAFSNAVSASSPLVIDLSAGHTGVTLTSWNASTTETYFDLNANGFAVQTAWVSGDTGLLARDLDSSGTIDSSAELFGSPTVDGFAKLAALDSNHDLRIDNNDADWSTLVVWTDDNGDAVTQSGELHSLASLGIANIDLAGVASSTSTISGNPISHTSKVTFTSGATATIADAWFVHDNTNSYYAGDYTLDVETLFLPTLRGYGTLPDLTIAMSQDSDLKDLVADFAGNFTLSSFADASSLKGDITEILYAWAGVSSVDPDGRGIYVDGQHLAVLEKLMGTNFFQVSIQDADPLAQAGTSLELAYQRAFDMIAANLLVQVGAASLFADTVVYESVSGTIKGDLDLSETAVDSLIALAPPAGPDNDAFWEMIGRFLDLTKGLSNLSVTEIGWLDDAVNATDAGMHWTDVLNMIDQETPGNTINGTMSADMLNGGSYNDTVTGYDGADTIHGNGGGDTIHGNDGDDTIYGDAGADTLFGDAGNDTLYGGDGDDALYSGIGTNTLSGGAGGNYLNGDSGNDTYVYGGGDDVIYDAGGTDQIILPSGTVLSDLSFFRTSTENSTSNFKDLLIEIDGSGSIQIQDFYNAIYSRKVETIVFSDSSTLSLSSIGAPDVRLTNGNDSFVVSSSASYSIYGGDGDDYIYAQGSGSRTIDGGAGNDHIIDYTGNDTFIASAGFDFIEAANGGTDTIVIPAAFDLSDVTFYRIINSGGLTNNLGITIEGLGQIAVGGQFASSAYAVEYIHFLSDNSTLALTGVSVATLGTVGNDSLSAPSVGAGPDDVMDGREGNDTLSGGNGNDTYIFSAGNDIINESSGDDTIRVRDSYGASDISLAFVQYGSSDASLRLTDSDGNSVLVANHSSSNTYMVEHIAFADSTIWNISSMEIPTHGTDGNDQYLSGHDTGDASSADTIYGYAGNDTISGGNGNDVLYGGDGNDYIYGGSGDDLIYGGADSDHLYSGHHSTIYGDAGIDYLYNNATSGEAASTLVTLNGGDGADTLNGGYGATVMNGGGGSDTIWAWSGAQDTIVFDAATAFTGVDTIGGFDSFAGHDKLDISDILDGHFTPGTDDITDFVQIQTNGSHSELYVDATGTATFGSSQHIATIQYVTGLTDEAALVTAGTLLAA